MKHTNRKKVWQYRIGFILMISLIVMACFLEMYGCPERNAYITLVIMVVAMFFFITEIVSISIVSILIPILLTLLNVITPNQAFQGFANDNVILFASMFIVGETLFRTGVAKRMGYWVVNLTKENERLLLIGIAILVSITSAFLSNTGTVAMLLPICLSIVDYAGWSRKNILLVLAMTASTGGMITLVGTPPNITVNAILAQNGLEAFHFLEFAWIGLPVSVLSGVWLVLFLKPSKKLVEKESIQVISVQNKLTKEEMLSVIILGFVIIFMIFEILPFHIVASLGAVTCVCTRLISEKEAMQSIDWTTIFLFAGTLVLAQALDDTGAGRILANAVVRLLNDNTNETILLTTLFVFTVLMTQFMSNTAICACLAPIGIQIAESLNANPHGVLMVIAVASSSAFATPMATPPNALVMGPGNLKMKDFLKIGIPLIGISYLISVMIIPHIWPLY